MDALTVNMVLIIRRKFKFVIVLTIAIVSVFPYIDHLVKGLRKLHQLRLMHRDLKPANILVARNEDNGIILVCAIWFFLNHVRIFFRKLPILDFPKMRLPVWPFIIQFVELYATWHRMSMSMSSS
jgi:serine/threonine protein kinase